MVLAPKYCHRDGDECDEPESPIAEDGSEVIAQESPPFIIMIMMIVMSEKHTVAVLKMTLSVSVFSILLVSSIFPFLSSAYTLKSRKKMPPPYPPSEQCTELWDSYGTQFPLGFEIWIPVKVPYQKINPHPHKVPYQKLYFRDNFPNPDSVVLHARCTIH